MMLPILGFSGFFTFFQNRIINSQRAPQGCLQERIRVSTRNLLDSTSSSSHSSNISAKVITPGDFTKLYQMDGITGLIASYLEIPGIKKWDEESGILQKPLTLAIIETELANRLTFSGIERERALSAGFGSNARSIMLYALNQLGMTSRDLVYFQSDYDISLNDERLIVSWQYIKKFLEIELIRLKFFEHSLNSGKIETEYSPGMLPFKKLKVLHERIVKQQLEKTCSSVLDVMPSLMFKRGNDGVIFFDLPAKLPFCPAITTLIIGQSSYPSMPHLAEAFPNLIDITLNKIHSPKTILEQMKYIKILKKLSMNDCLFYFEFAAYLKNFSILEAFKATDCHLTFIPFIPESLTSLDISHNPLITDISKEQEVRLSRLKELRFTELKDPKAQKSLVRASLAIDKAKARSCSSSSSSLSSLSIKPKFQLSC